ncbi:MAG: nuclear transport factor 2 family protein [Rhizomicrobium sp.]
MVLNCEDRLSIHELLGRYYRLLDGDDRIAVEAIFTEDAALIVPTVRFADRKAIAAFFCSRRAVPAAPDATS